MRGDLGVRSGQLRAAAECSEFERMGIADGRWRMVEQASFAKSVFGMDDDGNPFEVQLVSVLNCAKAKWRFARPCPAKLYQCSASRLRG